MNGVNCHPCFGEVQLVLLSYFWLETKVREPSPCLKGMSMLEAFSVLSLLS